MTLEAEPSLGTSASYLPAPLGPRNLGDPKPRSPGPLPLPPLEPKNIGPCSHLSCKLWSLWVDVAMDMERDGTCGNYQEGRNLDHQWTCL